jgi:hypothetical protein
MSRPGDRLESATRNAKRFVWSLSDVWKGDISKEVATRRRCRSNASPFRGAVAHRLSSCMNLERAPG